MYQCQVSGSDIIYTDIIYSDIIYIYMSHKWEKQSEGYTEFFVIFLQLPMSLGWLAQIENISLKV